MKKILLGTSALIGAATLLAGAAFGDDPKVTIGGFSTFEAAFAKSDNGSGVQDVAFRNDNELHFNVAGKTDAGLGYGAEVDLIADVNGAGTAQANGNTGAGLTAHRTYGWLQGDNWGHFEFGSNDGAARNLKVDASNIARATGGIDGDWEYFAQTNNPVVGNGAFAGGRSFITAPRLPVEAGPSTGFASEATSNDTKVTYYTPRFSGFQLGVSYAPSTTNRGETVITTTSTAGSATDFLSGGLNYEGQFDQVGVAVAVTGETANADTNVPGPNVNDVQAWNAGAKLSYMGFSAAGSYGDWQDSFASSGTKADYWTGGLAYETGPLGASVTYLGSESKPTGQDNKFYDVSLGVDYKLAPGLTPFVEWTYYDVNGTGGSVASGAVENRGNVVIVGSQLSF